jgi:hypothetical protein
MHRREKINSKNLATLPLLRHTGNYCLSFIRGVRESGCETRSKYYVRYYYIIE